MRLPTIEFKHRPNFGALTIYRCVPLILVKWKKYRITIRTYFGSFEIDDIEAKDEDEAFDRACEEAKKEIDCAKLDEVYEYDS